jgi:maltooligosyltrehalose trehalohydrolase
MSTAQFFPPRCGARLLTTRHTRFSLWAPAAQHVDLQLETSAPRRMNALSDGYYTLDIACRAGSCYRYLIDGEIAVPDPASRAQASGVHGCSVVVDQNSYKWQNRHWRCRPWHQTVLYELHVGCYGGSYTGVAARLPQLAELGVTMIELMPLAEFAGRRNWGYDGVLPYAPSSVYGSPNQLKALIDTAHGLGLAVCLDVVYNHFGPEGNYLNRYAPQFFDSTRPSPWGSAIDFSLPQVREFFIANALYWVLEYRFDGLRLDAVHAIDDKRFVDELSSQVRAATEPDRRVHLILENENNDAGLLHNGYDAQWSDDGHNALHVLLTGERESYYADYSDHPARKLARCLSEGFAYQGELSPTKQKPRGTVSSQLPPNSFVLFLQNHDQVGNRARGERLIRLCSPQALRAAVALMLLSPQIPMLFMGEEFGAQQPFLYFTDFSDELADAVREGRRREFAAFAAFSYEAARQQIPDPNAESSYRDSCLPADPQSLVQADWLSYYRKLLQLRHAEITPELAGAYSTGAFAISPLAVIATWILGRGSQLWIGLNLGNERVGVSPPGGICVFDGYGALGAPAAPYVLPPYCCRAYLEPAS